MMVLFLCGVGVRGEDTLSMELGCPLQWSRCGVETRGRPPAYKLLRVCTGSHADIYLSQHTDGELGKAFYFDYCYGIVSAMSGPKANIICPDFALHF